jgi:hypothetical protein
MILHELFSFYWAWMDWSDNRQCSVGDPAVSHLQKSFNNSLSLRRSISAAFSCCKASFGLAVNQNSLCFSSWLRRQRSWFLHIVKVKSPFQISEVFQSLSILIMPVVAATNSRYSEPSKPKQAILTRDHLPLGSIWGGLLATCATVAEKSRDFDHAARNEETSICLKQKCIYLPDIASPQIATASIPRLLAFCR